MDPAMTLFGSSALDAATARDQGPAAVRLADVSKTFDRTGRSTPVLVDINLTVAPGEFVCLLGASGCGKSTLLSLIAGLETPTQGVVEVAGQPVDGRGGSPAALMFQEAALFPWLSAGKNVELALRLRGVPRGRRRAEAQRLLRLVRLDGAYDKRVHQLSGGMRQRVAMARALAQESSVLLMDEPFAALDAITRDVLHEELTRIWTETGLSVIFVTHNVREAVRLGQRVVLLSSRPGRIAREWRVDIPQPRRIESPAVAELAAEITEHLRKEIARHGRA
ncbi:sulfate ABC transporter ATP-binding protein [Carbonactinospora thermoautotrophica]|uniref:ABC transporter related protein n=1 Tax=Carbonactinospora thermoautotrophica TaxID=1469144 RepID=A0A132MRG9_9ACTN|nr:ABC transporter related protein [Carbonactinospora thermoautotrophica]KWX04329.1 sulfate ABC transporter ATP-binding protein [Carbonactinospora thermoautotrophica]KWX08223.1 sulfate ABC transporter ATP-binding protein [Carbonactinospora thermoautotrophica]